MCGIIKTTLLVLLSIIFMVIMLTQWPLFFYLRNIK